MEKPNKDKKSQPSEPLAAKSLPAAAAPLGNPEEIKRLKARIARLEKQRKQEKEELAWDRKAAEEAHEREVQKLKEEIAFLRNKQTVEAQKDEKANEVDQLKGELAQVKIASGQMMEQLDRETERVKSDLEEARKRQAQTRRETDGLRHEMARLQDELRVTQAERDELVQKIRTLQQSTAESGRLAKKTTPMARSEQERLDQEGIQPASMETMEDTQGEEVWDDHQGTVKIGKFSKGFTLPGEVPPDPNADSLQATGSAI